MEGADAVVLGRSLIVGKPVAIMLMANHATVTVCHSRTKDIFARVKQADIVICAIGKSEFVRGEHLKPGAVVIDVGINRTNSGLVGDVDFDSVVEVAGAITPVPGGVGPMTRAMLLSNTLLAAKARRP